MVSVYRLAPATYQLALKTRLLRRQFFALPNILANEALVPELIQEEVTGAAVAREALRWMHDKTARQALSARFDALHREMLGAETPTAARLVASLVARRQ